MSYVTSLYHIVFSTYDRKPVITNQHRGDLYRVISAEIKQLKCKSLIINGVQDHLHILLSLHPTVALSDLIRDIKSKSSVWARGSGLFPLFEGWEREYGAFSISNTHKDLVYKYIENQQTHHSVNTFDDEYQRLLMKAGLQIYTP
jgi:REP element-mobilizing transposase RayT